MAEAYQKRQLKSGGDAIVFNFNGGVDYPLIGAWWADVQERWIPCAWDKDGCLIDKHTPTELDLVG